MSRKPILVPPIVATAAAALLLLISTGPATAGASPRVIFGGGTRTPIKHVVVIFQENVSFDHYFGTYPNAANTDGQTFNAAAKTPSVNGLTQDLLTNNPNQSEPQRLDSSPIGLPGSPGGQLTCDQDHDYTDEQTAFDAGRMDKFVQSVGTGPGTNSPFGTPCNANQVMDYYDGNTVTALWNYAQHFAMSDNSYGTTFGPSSPGAINLASGNTTVDSSNNGALLINGALDGAGTPNADLTPNGQGGYSLTSDAQPYYDDCSTRDAAAMAGSNIGDELNTAGLSWGWFEGGFRPSTSFQQTLAALGTSQPTSQFTPDEFKSDFASATSTTPAGPLASLRPPHSSNETLCSSVHPVGVALRGTGQWGYKDDYIPHHDPFQYYESTANPHHLTIPTDASGNDTVAGLSTIGRDTQSYVNGVPQFNTPNHQYDSSDFDQLVSAITAGQLPASALPAVSFLKAPGYQDGHGAYSDPADEQAFVTGVINALEASPDWHSTAVIISYDDSDGWYDHAFSGVTNPSVSGADSLTGAGQCGTESPAFQPLGGEQGRCGLGPRLPFLVISPYAKHNYVDHNVSDQSSILNLIEYNWRLPGIPGSADQLLAMRDRWEGIPFDVAGMFNFCATNPKLVLDPGTGQPVASGGDRHSGQNDQGCDGGSGDQGGDSQSR
jgi:phospholipase C